MTFDDDARRLILENVERFARERVRPRAAAIDRDNLFPRDLFDEAAALGLFGLGVPEEYGGLGRDIVTPLLISERLARESAAFALIFNNTTDSTVPIVDCAGEALKRRYLPAIARGELIPCISITEPQGGSDVSAIRSSARRHGDGYVLTGRKMWCSNAGVGDLFTIFVRTDPAGGHRGLSAFLVPKDAPGLKVGRPEDLIGLRGSPIAELILEDVEVPAANLLGREGDGFRIAMLTLDESRLHCAAMALGVATKAASLAIDYARQREQFGQPIIRHQGLQFLLADMATELAAARALWQSAARRMLAAHDREASVHCGMTKLVCSDLCMKITTDAVQVLGANGLSRAYEVERLMRDAKAFQIFDGTSQIQRSMIGRYLDREGLPFGYLEA
ncbi:MAG: acyl-CoA dehydrogenase family protein [Dongiaceae bacterium]